MTRALCAALCRAWLLLAATAALSAGRRALLPPANARVAVGAWGGGCGRATGGEGGWHPKTPDLETGGIEIGIKNK